LCWKCLTWIYAIRRASAAATGGIAGAERHDLGGLRGRTDDNEKQQS
jgi:hypothetical protein